MKKYMILIKKSKDGNWTPAIKEDISFTNYSLNQDLGTIFDSEKQALRFYRLLYEWKNAGFYTKEFYFYKAKIAEIKINWEIGRNIKR